MSGTGAFVDVFKFGANPRRNGSEKRRRLVFPWRVVIYQDVVVVCVLMFLRKGVKAERGGGEESGERREQELEKITKQNKQTNINGRRIGEEDRIWKRWWKRSCSWTEYQSEQRLEIREYCNGMEPRSKGVWWFKTILSALREEENCASSCTLSAYRRRPPPRDRSVEEPLPRFRSANARTCAWASLTKPLDRCGTKRSSASSTKQVIVLLCGIPSFCLSVCLSLCAKPSNNTRSRRKNTPWWSKMNPGSLVVLKIVVIASEHRALCASSPSLKEALE